eukprot:s1670_g3.t1
MDTIWLVVSLMRPQLRTFRGFDRAANFTWRVKKWTAGWRPGAGIFLLHKTRPKGDVVSRCQTVLTSVNGAWPVCPVGFTFPCGRALSVDHLTMMGGKFSGCHFLDVCRLLFPLSVGGQFFNLCSHMFFVFHVVIHSQLDVVISCPSGFWVPAGHCTIPHVPMAKIDVLQDDRGLAACLKGANLQQEWIDNYVKHHHIVTLDDFVYMIKASDWETSLGEHVEQVAALRGNRIAMARFKSAFEFGQQALKHAAQVAPKSEDLDEALPESTVQQLNSDWTKRYSLTFDPTLEPSEQLRVRVHREFRKQTMTVVEMKRVRSVLSMAQPRASDSIALPGGLHLQLEKEVAISLRSVTDYYFALRVLGHAWAWAGNFLVTPPATPTRSSSWTSPLPCTTATVP